MFDSLKKMFEKNAKTISLKAVEIGEQSQWTKSMIRHSLRNY